MFSLYVFFITNLSIGIDISLGRLVDARTAPFLPVRKNLFEISSLMLNQVTWSAISSLQGCDLAVICRTHLKLFNDCRSSQIYKCPFSSCIWLGNGGMWKRFLCSALHLPSDDHVWTNLYAEGFKVSNQLLESKLWKLTCVKESDFVVSQHGMYTETDRVFGSTFGRLPWVKKYLTYNELSCANM